MEITARRASTGHVRALVWLGVVAVLVAGGYYAYHRHRAAQRAASAPPQYVTDLVSVGSVTATVSASGSIQAAATQNASPQVSGNVSHVDVTVGQTVKAGDPVFELADTQGLGQQVTAAESAVAQAQQQLQQLLDPTAGQDPRTVEQAQLKVQQAEITLQQAQLTLQKDQAAAAAAAAATTPVAGTVQSVAVVAGQQVSPGTVIATVQPGGGPTVTVAVPEEDLPYLPVGTAATVVVPSLQQTFTGSVTARSNTPSGQVTLNASGQPVTGGAGAGTSQQSLYPLTVALTAPPTGAPANATALVTFTPAGTPPPTFIWTDTGTVVYPSPVSVTAPQAGTVSDLVQQGASVTAGQSLATIANPNSQVTIQQDEFAVQQDQIALQEAQISLSQAQNPQPATPEAIAAQRSAVQSAQQQLQLKQQALAQLTVRAPMAGTVTAVNVRVGDQVGPATVGVVLQATSTLQAVVNVDETDVAKVRPGQAAQVTLSALPGKTYTGKVVSVSPTAQTQGGVSTYPVTVALDDTSDLRVGMSASATIVVQEVQNTLRVRSAAVQSKGGGQATVRLLQNGHAVSADVQVGLQTPTWTQIVSGLQPGQSVIIAEVPAGSRSRSGAGGAAGAGGFAGGPGGFGGGGGTRGNRGAGAGGAATAVTFRRGG